MKGKMSIHNFHIKFDDKYYLTSELDEYSWPEINDQVWYNLGSVPTVQDFWNEYFRLELIKFGPGDSIRNLCQAFVEVGA